MRVLEKGKSVAGAALILLAGIVASSAPVRAENGQVTAGVIGGLAAGALLGAAVANHNNGPYVEEVYPAPPPQCWKERVQEPLFDAYGNIVGYRPVVRRVCR